LSQGKCHRERMMNGKLRQARCNTADTQQWIPLDMPKKEIVETQVEMFPVDDVVEAEAMQILDFVSAHSQDPNFTTSPEQEFVVNPKVMLSTEIAALILVFHFKIKISSFLKF